MANPTVGQTVLRLRKEQGIARERLAAKADISTSTLVRLERGDGNGPRLDTLRRVADALGVPLTDLLGEAA